MRLDHLLSKEHWHLSLLAPGGWWFVKGVQVASSQTNALWGLLKGGTSVIWHCMPGGFASTCFSFGGVVERGVVGGVVPGTLLGPEGSGVLLPRFFSAGLACWSYRRGS